MNRILPVVLVGLAVAVVMGIGLLWSKKPSSSVHSNPKTSSQSKARLVIAGGSAESLQRAALSGEMRSVLPEHLTLSMIEEIRAKDGRKVLVFTDGSELEVSPYLMAQLPSEVRLRLEYQRGAK